jgi:hypothetical protein
LSDRFSLRGWRSSSRWDGREEEQAKHLATNPGRALKRALRLAPHWFKPRSLASFPSGSEVLPTMRAASRGARWARRCVYSTSRIMAEIMLTNSIQRRIVDAILTRTALNPIRIKIDVAWRFKRGNRQ